MTCSSNSRQTLERAYPRVRRRYDTWMFILYRLLPTPVVEYIESWPRVVVIEEMVPSFRIKVLHSRTNDGSSWLIYDKHQNHLTHQAARVYARTHVPYILEDLVFGGLDLVGV